MLESQLSTDDNLFGESFFRFPSGGAASLDSQGRKPLERINMHRESRSDGIGAPLANTANATAPPFTIPRGHKFQGLAPLAIE